MSSSEAALWKARYTSLVTSHADLISRFRPDGQLTYVSQSYCDFFQVAEETFLSASIYEFIPVEECARTRERIAALAPDNPVTRGENAVTLGSGHVRQIDWVNCAIFGDDGETLEIQSVGRDVTAQRELETDLRAARARLELMAGHDALTGLPNRRLLVDRLQQGLNVSAREGNALAVIFVDLDGFKQINDNFGHHVGDTILQITAARMLKTVRASDTVARMGGDEFVVVSGGNINSGSAVHLAGKLAQEIERPSELNGVQVSVGASIGVAMSPDHGTAPEPLLQAADAAMYLAKRSKQNRIQLAR